MSPIADLPFTTPWVLLALPLALLGLMRRPQTPLLHSWAALVPRDRLSNVLDALLHALAVVAIAALLLGLAGLYRPAYDVEKVGRGAEIVLLLDRSRSMDQAFITASDGKRMQDATIGTFNSDRKSAGKARPSKKVTARHMLGDFVARRSADRFGMIVFSTLPIRTLAFTGKPEAVEGAIAAQEIGHGLAETDIGLALRAALESFRGQPYTGSRIIMLVSDGGDVLDDEARTEITKMMREYRVSLYWFYIRSFRSPGLNAEVAADGGVAPEASLHHFFQSMGTPYRAYEAEDPEALQRAIADVDRLENLPITYTDTVPPRDLAPWCYAVALGCVMLLLGAKLMELRAWR